MKIVVTGTRGIPNILGGVETHCQELFPRIAAMGHDVTVIRRKCYITPDNVMDNYKGVHLIDTYAPRRKSTEAAIHTLLAVIKAKRMGCDILHIHAVGPSIVVPVARLLGLTVVTTNHGHDYERKKWGAVAKCIIKMGEYFASHLSHGIIAISPAIAERVRKEYGRNDINIIYNGFTHVIATHDTEYIQSLGVEPHKYVLALGRFVKEKCFDQLIEAFTRANLSDDYRLVIAGDADHEDEYSTQLKHLAASTPGVVLPGFVSGEPLAQLLINAALFVLPSSHEGLPISLLEAMSYKRDVVVSDITANRLPELNADDFFPVGNIDALAEAISHKVKGATHERTYDMSAYDWDNIAQKTVAVYNKVLAKR